MDVGALTRLRTRLRQTSLASRIIGLGVIVTAAAIAMALWALSAETRDATRQVFASQLSNQQHALLNLQQQNLRTLISSAAVISESPALRSAIETYRLEQNTGGPVRNDLVQTVERELANLATVVDRQLLMVTDDRGRVFAAASRDGRRPNRGVDLSDLKAVREALDPNTAGTGALAVYRDGERSYQVAVYPFVLNGYTIGALLLGERIGADQGVLANAHAAFGGDIVVTAGTALLASVGSTPSAELIAQLVASSHASPDSTRIVKVGHSELVIAPLSLGETQMGEHVALWLLQPIDATVASLTGPLFRDFLLYGALAVILAALGAALAARSVLKSFHAFVAYMRTGATAERVDHPFDADRAPAEVRTLNDSFVQLMNDISAKRSALERRTTELTAANAVLVDEVRERQRMEQALRQSEEQLRQSQKLEAIGTLAGGIAHDFNNLLTAVSGFTQLALMRSDPKGPVAADLRQVVEAADRAAHLTKQLLAFGRKQVLQPTVLDIAEVVRGVSPMLARLLGEHIQLDLVADDNVARVIADKGQLEQVIINLAINARDAMPGGGVLTIRVANAVDARATRAAGSAQAHVVLTVSDTGTGIPASIRDRIFEPFFTTKEAGKGTGLGLSTVYGIIKQSGGTIDLDSIEGVGTTFRISLPAASDEMIPGLMTDPAADLPSGTETILLVEDDADVRSFARRTLEERGYTVLPANGALEALELAASARADVLLSDIVMPELNGPMLAERLRLQRQLPAVVIFMSGYADESLVSMGLNSGSAFLRKPFTPATLARTVRDAIDSARAAPRASRPGRVLA
jgi:signal transduction histidine kinase/ActR/RegA family two-component response regulator